jgi:hypothetical protein
VHTVLRGRDVGVTPGGMLVMVDVQQRCAVCGGRLLVERVVLLGWSQQTGGNPIVQSDTRRWVPCNSRAACWTATVLVATTCHACKHMCVCRAPTRSRSRAMLVRLREAASLADVHRAIRARAGNMTALETRGERGSLTWQCTWWLAAAPLEGGIRAGCMCHPDERRTVDTWFAESIRVQQRRRREQLTSNQLARNQALNASALWFFMLDTNWGTCGPTQQLQRPQQRHTVCCNYAPVQ